MKHKIIASNLSAFDTLFDNLIRRLEQVGEKVVKAKFSFSNDSLEYCATIWTERESKEAK